FQGIAVGIEDKKRLFDRRRFRVTDRSVEFKLALFGGANHIGKISRGDFEAVYHAVQRPRRSRRDRKILQRHSPTLVIRQRVKQYLWHLAIEPADRQVGQMVQLATHKRRVEAMRPAEIVARDY